MDECRWIFVPVKDNLYETDYFTLNPNWYSDDFEKYFNNPESKKLIDLLHQL